MNEVMKLPKETLQEILNYLASRPYSEVYQLVNKLQAEATLVEDKQEHD